MGSYVVVEKPELIQGGVQLRQIVDRPAIQIVLERAEAALDTAVLPGAMPLGGLVSDALQTQGDLPEPGMK